MVTISFLTGGHACFLLSSQLRSGLRRVGDDAAGGEVDRRDGGAGEGEEQVGGAGAGDLEDVAGAVVEDGADGAEGGAAGVDDGEADQVGVVELVVGERRQAVARGVEAGALQRLGLLAGGDAGEPRGEGAGDGRGELTPKLRPSSVTSGA